MASNPIFAELDVLIAGRSQLLLIGAGSFDSCCDIGNLIIVKSEEIKAVDVATPDLQLVKEVEELVKFQARISDANAQADVEGLSAGFDTMNYHLGSGSVLDASIHFRLRLLARVDFSATLEETACAIQRLAALILAKHWGAGLMLLNVALASKANQLGICGVFEMASNPF